MGELDLEALLRFFKKNPWFAIVAVYLIASFLRAITRGVKGDAKKPSGAPRIPARRVADVDLQERVRAGFEQMMRERAAGHGAAPRAAAAAPAPAPAISPARAPASPWDDRAPDDSPPPAPRLTVVRAPERAPANAPRRPPLTPAIARVRGIARADAVAAASGARRLLGDRPSLRRAMLASEILGSPVALREPR